MNGDALALDADNGSVLWRNATGGAIGGGVITYQSAGHQRVAIASGMSPQNWPVAKAVAKVIVYGLP
jgi:alcohol dehydrogenase (cytochrome c)